MHRLGLLLVGVFSAASSVAPPGWVPVSPAMERVEFPLAERGLLASVHVIAFRLQPCGATLEFVERTRYEGLRGAWAVDSMDATSVLAINGGQFREGSPWGWIVRDGVERQAPGIGSLGMALVLDGGAVKLLRPDEIAAARGTVREAMQSYPTLLVDGEMPPPLRAPGRGVDLEHRDSRLAIGVDAEGRVLVVLTRFKGLPGAGGTLPLGPTIPELARVMHRLGAVRAMGLDGGLSSQLAARAADGSVERYTNWRLVPMGIVARPAARGC
ncbi:MAG: phosphodiester glycosidase family protein [Gemmatimonadota bacterium]